MEVRENEKMERYRARVEELEQTVAAMQKRLADVSAALSELKQNVPETKFKEPVMPEPEEASVSSAAEAGWRNVSGWDQEPVRYDFAADVPKSEIQPHIKHSEPDGKTDDMENKIGKSLMGIIASALIFISLIFFATLIYPMLNDVVKVCTIYVLSTAFLVTGLMLLRRDRGSRIYISLAGCGVGALYLSLLLTNIYFEMIGDILLYALILVWVVGVCILSRLQSKIFLAIGQAGVFVSVIFGHILCMDVQNADKYIVLTIFYIAAFSIFYISHLDRMYAGNRISNIFFILNAYVYSAFISIDRLKGEGGGALIAASLLITLFVLAVFGLQICYIKPYRHSRQWQFTDARAHVGDAWEFGICNALLFVPLFILAGNTFALAGGSQNGVSVLYIVLSLCLLICVEYKFRRQRIGGAAGKGIMIICLLVFLITGTLMIPDMAEYCHLSVWVILCMALGFWLDDMLYKAAGMLMFSWLAVSVSMDYAFNLAAGILAFVLITALLHVRKEQYRSLIKCWSYLTFQILLLKDLSLLFTAASDWRSFVLLLVPALVNFVAICSKYAIVPGSGERDVYLENVTGIVNAALMLWSLPLMHVVSDSVCHILVIFVSLALFMVNTGRMMNMRQGQDRENASAHMVYFGRTGTDIYIGCKFTIWMIVMLKSYGMSNYIVSIMCFVLAIVSVAAGFGIKRRVFRLYGLVLSLVSVVKLVMVDIYYDNTVGRALSFFVSGLLCFVISIIYNRIDKRMKKDEKG